MLELVEGIEPSTSSLPRTRSTPELHEQLALHASPIASHDVASFSGKAGRELNKNLRSVKKNISLSAFFLNNLVE